MGIAKAAYPDLISGYDLVNEEDFCDDVTCFAGPIIQAQEQEFTVDSDGNFTKTPNVLKGMGTYMHGGETHNSSKTNMHASVVLNGKRIGHGLQLALFPNLIEEIKKRDICIEVCPLSNFVLGYTLDLRTHPAKYLMAQGVQISISPDDPAFFNYEAVALDYIYAVLAWELDIRDLKKLSLNGIKYSSINEKRKQDFYKEFETKWAAWIDWLSTFDTSAEEYTFSV
jgi:adenosine deaminase CECR1